VLQRRRPGDKIRVTIRHRGITEDVTITLEEDPRLQVVPVENTGRQLTPAERGFRDAWLGSKQ
jgi:predicted metalloprotease with PDZ domain